MAHVIRLLLSIIMVLLFVTQSGCGGNKKKRNENKKRIKAHLEDSNISNKKKLKFCEDEVRDVLDKYEKGKKDDDEENELIRQIEALCMGITEEVAVEDVDENGEDFSKRADVKDIVAKLKKPMASNDNVLKENCASFSDLWHERVVRTIGWVDTYLKKMWGLAKPVLKRLKKKIRNNQLNDNEMEELNALAGPIKVVAERGQKDVDIQMSDFNLIYNRCKNEWPLLENVIVEALKGLMDQKKKKSTVCNNILRPCNTDTFSWEKVKSKAVIPSGESPHKWAQWALNECRNVWLGKWTEEFVDVMESTFGKDGISQILIGLIAGQHGSLAFKEEHGEHDEKVEGEEAQGQRMQGGVERHAHLKIDS